MAARSDDDVSDTPSGQKKAGDGVERDDDAGDTTAALRKPVPTDGTGEDDRTVRRNLDTKLLRAERARATQTPLGGVQPRDTKPAAVRMTSKKPTAQGLGVPVPLTRRTASVPPPVPPPLPTPKKANEAEEADDSITATAPALVAPTVASIVPTGATVGAVKIQQIGDDEGEGDETEVRTVVGVFARGDLPRRPLPAPAAGRPPTPPPPDDDGAEAIDDSVTAQAPSIANLPADDEPSTQPPILSPAALPALTKGRTAAKSVDMYETDESVTSRGPAVADYDDDDDVTADRPAIGNDRRSNPAPGPARLVDDEDEDDHPHNHTAVMMNAPVKPPDRPPPFATSPMGASPMSGRAVAAARDSDSGLRIAPTVRNDAGNDHASVAVLLAGVPPPPPPRFGETDGDRRSAPAFSPLDPLAVQHADPLAQPKKPNYGLIVGVTAGLSVLIPLVLYFALRGGAVPAEPRTPAEVEPDPIGTSEVARPRATRPQPTAPPSSTTKRTWWKGR